MYLFILGKHEPEKTPGKGPALKPTNSNVTQISSLDVSEGKRPESRTTDRAESTIGEDGKK